MNKILTGFFTAFCFLVVPTSYGQPEVELLELRGELTSVDYDWELVAVRAADGKEAIFEIDEETKIVYTDPETEEVENLDLMDLEPGLKVLVRFIISGEANLARVIEVQSFEIGN